VKKQRVADNKIVIYQSKKGNIRLDVKLDDETVWLTQAQMTELFARDRTVITRHINNIFKEGELIQKSNVQNLHFAHSDKPIKTYSLDVAISVGYRVKSLEGTHFRQWATKVLRQHIVDGYTINRKRIKMNYDKFLKAVTDIKQLLPDNTAVDNDSVLELIKLFADTWFSLDAYDKDTLATNGSSKKKVKLTAVKLAQALSQLKQNLLAKNEATDIFGVERTTGSVEGIVGNVMQGFADQDAYPTVEEKAAHLLYFIIKDHPFIDGNKRSGAYAFIWFLQQAKMLNLSRMTPPALTALTLLIAESNPKDKAKMVALVCNLLSHK